MAIQDCKELAKDFEEHNEALYLANVSVHYIIRYCTRVS